MRELHFTQLGDLELSVLEIAWRAESVDVRSVYNALGAQRSIASNTVQSTLERLFRKGLLARDKVGHAYRYTARQTRIDVTVHMIAIVLRRLGLDDRDAEHELERSIRDCYGNA